jgi:hypothetical protein
MFYQEILVQVLKIAGKVQRTKGANRFPVKTRRTPKD